MTSKVINMDDYRNLEDIIKNRLGAESVVIAAVLPDNVMSTYIPNEISDIDLVYLIETLKDRRRERIS